MSEEFFKGMKMAQLLDSNNSLKPSLLRIMKTIVEDWVDDSSVEHIKEILDKCNAEVKDIEAIMNLPE